MNYIGTIGYRTGTIGHKLDEAFCASLVVAWDFLLREGGKYTDDAKWGYNFARGQSCMLWDSANRLADQLRGDWLLMLDTDHVFQNDALFELIQTFEENKLDLLCGFTQRRQFPYQPNLWQYDFDPEHIMRSIIPKGLDKRMLLKVDVAGLSCLIVRKRVFDKLRLAYPHERPFDLLPKFPHASVLPPKCKEAGMLLGDMFWEDISFFKRIRDCGFQLWCAPWISFPHLETRMVLETLIDEPSIRAGEALYGEPPQQKDEMAPKM